MGGGSEERQAASNHCRLSAYSQPKHGGLESASVSPLGVVCCCLWETGHQLNVWLIKKEAKNPAKSEIKWVVTSADRALCVFGLTKKLTLFFPFSCQNVWVRV